MQGQGTPGPMPRHGWLDFRTASVGGPAWEGQRGRAESDALDSTTALIFPSRAAGGRAWEMGAEAAPYEAGTGAWSYACTCT